MMKVKPSSSATEPVPRRQASKGTRGPAWPPQTRAGTPAQAAEAIASPADATGDAFASRPAAKPHAAKPAADPTWVGPLRAALAGVHEAEDRLRQAQERLPRLRQDEEAARRPLASAEVALEMGRATDADVTHAKHRAEVAEAERAKADRIVVGLADLLEERRSALRPLLAAAERAVTEMVDAALVDLDVQFAALIHQAAGIAAQGLALADAARAQHLSAPMLRLRLPASITHGDAVIAIGQMAGKVPVPVTTQASAMSRIADLVVAARAAVETPTTSQRETA